MWERDERRRLHGPASEENRETRAFAPRRQIAREVGLHGRPYEELLGLSTLGRGVLIFRVLRRRSGARRIQVSGGLENLLVHLLI